MIAKTFSATLRGLDGEIVKVEAAKQRALPAMHVTGLPGEVVKESRERVRACLVGLGFEVPSSRLVVHLSPADTRKQGSQFDLAIAMAVLQVEEFFGRVSLDRMGFIGELSLDGKLRPVTGAVALIEAMEADDSLEVILIPEGNAREASLLGARKARLAGHLRDAIELVRGTRALPSPPEWKPPTFSAHETAALDRVVGQGLGKRGLEIALAGRHHLLLVGPPGVGKSLLAGCAPTLLPPLDRAGMIEAAKNRGGSCSLGDCLAVRPFRSPHHSISASGLLGGGSGAVHPGEVTASHSGVLFLDEFPEFRRDVLEGIREPLQTGIIHLGRVGQSLSLPARFTLIAAMNPCPCGYAGSSTGRCSCPADRVRSYRKRISGPILDRMDLAVMLSTPRRDGPGPGRLAHAAVRSRILGAWGAQRERFGDARIRNGDCAVEATTIGAFSLADRDREWLEQAVESSALSYRAFHKIIKVARTIADLEGRTGIHSEHVHEAWSLRCQTLSESPFAF